MSITPAEAGGGGWRAIAYLADDHELTPIERLVLYEFAARVDPTTATWAPVAVTDWARLLGTTYRTLRGAITGLERRGWVTARFPRGHDGAIQATADFWELLAPLLARAPSQLSAPSPTASEQERSPTTPPARLPTSAQRVNQHLPPGSGSVPALSLMPPGPSPAQESKSSKELPASLTRTIASRLGSPIADVLLSPTNTGARRKADGLLAAAAEQIEDTSGEVVVTRVLDGWPPAHDLRNPAGFLLQRARDVLDWASSPEARRAVDHDTSEPVPSPTAYGIAVAQDVLAGRQQLTEARYNCEFAFALDEERQAASEALDAVLQSAQMPSTRGPR